MTMALSEKELLAKVPTGLFIGGKWVEGSASKKISVEDPATSLTLLEIANATAEDGLRALTAADEAQASWARVSPRERSEILRRTFDLVRARSEEFAMLISMDDPF
jgi:succinate-semialdehyde dehydrogenase/glutarate-semialdehyde dehydrogenase